MTLNDLKAYVEYLEQRIDGQYKMENPTINMFANTPKGIFCVDIEKTEFNPVDNSVSIMMV